MMSSLSHSSCINFFLMNPPPPTSTLFPYTTLFRSLVDGACEQQSSFVLDDARIVDGREPGGSDALRESEQRSEEHTSELQSHVNLVCRLLLEKKKKNKL